MAEVNLSDLKKQELEALAFRLLKQKESAVIGLQKVMEILNKMEKEECKCEAKTTSNS